MKEIDELLKVMDTLRGENGCNWDKKQTHDTLIPYLLEESYEVVDALEKRDKENLKEELGDLLFQIVFHSKIASEKKEFEMKDVALGIIEKLIRRHPHVFREKEDLHPDEVISNWEKIKEKEKSSKKKNLLDDVPISFPALQRANKIQEKVSSVGFDWEDTQGVLDKVEEELNELKEEINQNSKNNPRIEEEFGDLMFSMVNLSRFLKINPETALRKANQKFENRFQFVEKMANLEDKNLKNMSKEEMEILWQKSKKIDNH